MSRIGSLIQKLRKKRALLLQLLFVTLAFVLMIVSSSIFVRNILKEHLSRQAKDMLTQTKLKIESELVEPQTTLTVISTTIRSMIIQGSDADAVAEYLRNVGAEIENKTIGFQFKGVFGYFETFGGVFLYSDGWEGEDRYEPANRPWYKAAVEAGDRIAVTPMYMSMRYNDYLITYVRRIFDNEGRPLGIVCIEVPLSRIRSYIVDMRITDSGYGILMSEMTTLIAHPDPGLLGKPVRQVSAGSSMLAHELEMGNNLFEREFENYMGQWTVTFTMRLENGWVLTLMTPKAEYYYQLRDMMFIISFLGACFGIVLMGILIRIDLARSRADEQNREKSVLLANMEKMHEADERTQLMLNATPLGCKLWSKDYKIIECNQELLNLFNLSNKQTVFDSFYKLSPEYQPCGKPSQELAIEYLKKAFDDGYLRFEWMHQKLNGEKIPAEIILVRVKHKGEYVLAGYIRDLREYQQMMRNIRNASAQLEIALKTAQDANTAKSKFLANMSHEIRTPMNVILGVTESQLLFETLPAGTKEAFEKIFDSGHLLLHIINDILDLSKIEAGKFELNPAVYDTLSLINDAANMNITQFGNKPLKFNLYVDENIPLHLYGDELRIKQVLNNLLSNAFKYTAAGEVRLSFSAEDATENKTILIIEVQDTGQGMTAEQIHKLYDEYARFNMEANRSTVGTGLGMAITRNLIDMMNGNMSVDSTPDVGTTFTVRIPQGISGSGLLGREAAENLQNFNFTNTERERHAKFVREPMPYGKVLLVDDMRSNLDVARLLLNPYKLQIDAVESGFEAVDIIRNGKVYDIIFMDHMMPKMDGMETTRQLRELGYTNPIIALTANAVDGQQEVFLANGFDGYISKPIDSRQLNASLNKLIRDKERARQQVSALPADVEYSESPSLDPASLPEINIPGVDAEKGLALYDGEVDVYITVLRFYVSNVITLVEKLRNVSEETLPEYTIDVHGLKGISAAIGAEKIKDDALKLELTARAGDFAKVMAGNPALLEETGKIISEIEAWLKNFDSQRPKPRLPRPDPVLLSRLRKCCEAYDMNGVDDIMEELESADYDTDGSLITWLRVKIDASDFPSAASGLSQYKEEDI